MINVGLVGCGLRCSFCFAGDVVQSDPEYIVANRQSPEKVIAAATQGNASIIRYTYNEPTNNFEYTLDTFKAYLDALLMLRIFMALQCPYHYYKNSCVVILAFIC